MTVGLFKLVSLFLVRLDAIETRPAAGILRSLATRSGT